MVKKKPEKQSNHDHTVKAIADELKKDKWDVKANLEGYEKPAQQDFLPEHPSLDFFLNNKEYHLKVNFITCIQDKHTFSGLHNCYTQHFSFNHRLLVL